MQQEELKLKERIKLEADEWLKPVDGVWVHYRAYMIDQAHQKRRARISKLYNYGSVAFVAFITGVYFGVIFTNGTW